MSTYDNAWYELAKNNLKDNWKNIEIYKTDYYIEELVTRETKKTK